MLRKENSGRERGRPESRWAIEDLFSSYREADHKPLSSFLHSPKVYRKHRVDRQKRSNRWRVVVTTRRRHPRVQGVWSKRGNWYRPVHLYSRHFWLISRVFSAFLKRAREAALNSPPRFSLFFPSLPFLSLRRRSLFDSGSALRPSHQHLSVFHSIASSHLSLYFIFFVPSFSLLLRTLLFSVDSMVSPAIYPRVYTEEEKEGRKTEKWKVLPLIHG